MNAIKRRAKVRLISYFCIMSRIAMNTTTQVFIGQHLHDDVNDLALRKVPADVDLALALRQIMARQLLEKKVPSWSTRDDLLFPPHLSIEQCSSEATAAYKATLLTGKRLVDLTGGLGIDSYFMAPQFEQAVYVEQDNMLCDLAKHNFQQLQSTIEVVHQRAEDYVEQSLPIDCIFIDPARRNSNGRKVFGISDCMPDVAQLQEKLLGKASQVLVKLSPMLDIAQALKALHHVKEVHVVSVSNECKELLLLMERGWEAMPKFCCVNLKSSQKAVSFYLDEEQGCPLRLSEDVMRYLYEPNASLLKAGCFKAIAQRYNLYKLHVNSHLYTSEQLLCDFPGRVFEVTGSERYGKRIWQTLLGDLTKVSIAVRNFPLSAADLRKVLHLSDGEEAYLFATTLRQSEKVVIRTRKVENR